MACMCGDTMCPSCGPAQGYDPRAELISEWLCDLMAELPEVVNGGWIADYLVTVFGDVLSEDTMQALAIEAKRYFDNQRMERMNK